MKTSWRCLKNVFSRQDNSKIILSCLKDVLCQLGNSFLNFSHNLTYWSTFMGKILILCACVCVCLFFFFFFFLVLCLSAFFCLFYFIPNFYLICSSHSLVWVKVKSSHWRCSVKKMFLNIWQNSQEKACVGASCLIKLLACNFIKKRLWHRYFPVNFPKFLRTTF